MQRKKILWLVSWYPNKNDRFDGDFIQRHARAAAIGNDVHVILVTDAGIQNSIEEEFNYATGLTEQIIYFKRKKGLAGKIKKQFTWRNLYKKAIKKYIAKHGLPDCVHVHVPWKAGLIALWMKKKYTKDFVVTEHWGIYNGVVQDHFFTKSKLTQTFVKKIFSEARIFVSVSKFLSKGVENIAGKKANLIIPNVVDTSLFFYKEGKYSKFTFIHVSNMVALKNVKGILDAFKILLQQTNADTQLILIGNRNHEYVKYAENLGMLNTFVFFRGEISYKEVAEEMQRSHCLVLNSVMENSPCVIGEALCCGLPVVATHVGGIPELLDESNSILIPSENIEALVIAMNTVRMNYFFFDQKQIANESAKKFGYGAVSKKFDELYDVFTKNPARNSGTKH